MGENKVYTVLEFVEECERNSTKVAVLNKLIKEINIKEYVPYSTKVFMAKKMTENACVKDGEFLNDSPKRYLSYIMSLIELYTDLELNEEDTSLEYDALKSSGMLTAIINHIGEEEFNEYKSIWKMVYEDTLRNHTSATSVIKRNIERFGVICNEGLLALAKAIDSIPVEDIVNRVHVLNKITSKSDNDKQVK